MPRSVPSSKILARRVRAARSATVYWPESRISVDRRVRRPASSWASPEGWAWVRSMQPSGALVNARSVSGPEYGPSPWSHAMSSSELSSWLACWDTFAFFSALTRDDLDHTGMPSRLSRLADFDGRGTLAAAKKRTPGGFCRPVARPGAGYSHSMVPGGLLVTSSTTRLTPSTSLVIRLEIRASRS